MKTTGNRLKELRGQRTMEVMGKLCRISGEYARQGWNNWESDRHLIPVCKAAILVHVEGISLDWLYLGKEPHA